MIVIGIDPGVQGVMVALGDVDVLAGCAQSLLADQFPLPAQAVAWVERVDSVNNIPAVVYILKPFKDEPCMAWLEGFRPFPKISRSTHMKLGISQGAWQAALASFDIPCTIVYPAVWQKAMHVGASGKTTKARSLHAAHLTFPSVSLRNPAKPKSRKEDHNLADALLIAEYGRRTLGR